VQPREERTCVVVRSYPSRVSSLTTDERKIVTTLFADLVDSTGLAQRIDSERAREVLGRFYDAATQELRNLRGRPEKFIGDAVMAVFGIQQVHEDDALRAVRAGLAIRERARRLGEELGLGEGLEVRIGIEAGEAATGAGPSAQLLVTGPVVNAAARLQAAAEPGEVLVGATAYQLTASAVDYGDRREVAAKGFEAPLAAFPVRGLSMRSVRRTIPFVGRADELAQLRSAFDGVVATREPAMVTIVGEPGAGKSRLADELIAAIGDGARVLRAQGTIAAGSETFAPVASILRELTSIDEHTPDDEAVERIATLARGCCEPAEFDRMVASLSAVIGVRHAGGEASTFVQDVTSGITRIVEELATAEPVVVVVEDAQDLEPVMLDLVERLATRARASALLVLVLARPALCDVRPDWATGERRTKVTLGPLALDDAVDLVRMAGGDRIADPDAEALAERAGGNPFFIVETTGMLAGADIVPNVRSVPPTVQAVVAARLDALPPVSRAVARAVSVFFVSFDVEEASVVADDHDLSTRLKELEEAELLVGVDDGAPRWMFRHSLLRDVAYASLPKRQRMVLHAAVAEHLVADGHRTWAAEHLEEAARASLDLEPHARDLPDRARDALAEAAERARDRMEHRTAVTRATRALALADDAERWGVAEARILAGIGESLYWLGDYPTASERLEQAIDVGERVGDGCALAQALRFLGDIAINVHADVALAERLLARSLEEAERIDDPTAITRTLLFQGWVPWTRHAFADAEPIWHRALALAREHGDRWAEVRALTSLSIDLVDMHRLDEAAELISQARDVAIAMGDRFSAAVAMVQTGRIHEERGGYEQAIPCLDHGVKVFEEMGFRWELADALAERGIIKREMGRLDEAERDLGRAIEISEELGERQLAGWTWRNLARVSERRGDTELAAERWRRADEAEARRPQ
jgi:class 3 adenylate cyclase/tetratricopeptide (TPR) repeat protein